MKRAIFLLFLIVVITVREAHGWLPPFIAHRREWWYQEWWFNALIVLAAFALGMIVSRNRR